MQQNVQRARPSQTCCYAEVLPERALCGRAQTAMRKMQHMQGMCLVLEALFLWLTAAPRRACRGLPEQRHVLRRDLCARGLRQGIQEQGVLGACHIARCVLCRLPQLEQKFQTNAQYELASNMTSHSPALCKGGDLRAVQLPWKLEPKARTCQAEIC